MKMSLMLRGTLGIAWDIRNRSLVIVVAWPRHFLFFLLISLFVSNSILFIDVT